MVKIILISMISLISIDLLRRKKFTIFLFNSYIFLTVSELHIPFISDLSIRMPIALVLIFFASPKIPKLIRLMKKYGFLAPIFILTLYQLIQITVHWHASYMLVYETISNALFYLVVAFVIVDAKKTELKSSLIILLLSFIPSMLLYYEVFRPFLTGIGFSVGSITYHQLLGQSAVFAFPLILIHTQILKHKIMRFFGLFASIGLIILTALAGARIPLVALLTQLLVWKRSLRWLIVILIASPVMFYVTKTRITERTNERYQRMFSVVNTLDASEDKNIGFRLNHYKMAKDLFLESPLFGHGPTGWREGTSRLMQQEYLLSTHSDWIHYIVNYGLIGFAIIISLLYAFTKKLNKKIRKEVLYQYQHAFALIILGCLIVSFWHTILVSRQFTVILAFAISLQIKAGERTSKFCE